MRRLCKAFVISLWARVRKHEALQNMWFNLDINLKILAVNTGLYINEDKNETASHFEV